MDIAAMPFMIPIVAIVGSFIMVCVICIAESIRKASDRKHLEESRREIAAYIAEGSMTPEQGERLMKAVPEDES